MRRGGEGERGDEVSKEVEELEYDEEATRCQFLLTSLNGFEPQVLYTF